MLIGLWWSLARSIVAQIQTIPSINLVYDTTVVPKWLRAQVNEENSKIFPLFLESHKGAS